MDRSSILRGSTNRNEAPYLLLQVRGLFFCHNQNGIRHIVP